MDDCYRIACVMSLGNPLGLNWVMGLRKMGAHVVVLDQRGIQLTPALREKWAIPEELKVIETHQLDDAELQRAVLEHLGGQPDLLFGWWGSGMLTPLRSVHRVFPSAKTVLCVDTLPDARGVFGELRELFRFFHSTAFVDGFIHYSQEMKASLCRLVPLLKTKQHLCMVEPFMRSSYGVESQVHTPRLERMDDQPYVIFTGRGDQLWSTEAAMKKDAVGQTLKDLCELGVRVYVPFGSDLQEIPNLHHYPQFSNQDLFNGAFSSYISDFDAHLVFYNEFNSTIRRRVANGLSTRYALAMTTTCPVAVTETSRFVDEHWRNEPYGFRFSSVSDLRTKLGDKASLHNFRQALGKYGISHSFEAKQAEISTFLSMVLTNRERHGA